MTDLEITRGDGRTILLWATDPTTDERVPFTGKRVWFTAKRRYSDADEDAVIAKGLNTGDDLEGIAIATVEVVEPGEGESEDEVEQPPGAGGEVVVVTLLPEDTASLASYTVTLKWDAQYADAPDGAPRTPADWRGTLTITPDVSQAV